MKNLTFIFLLGITFFSQSQPLNRSFEKANGDINLLGLITAERMNQSPFQEWYQESYQSYEVDENILKPIALPDSITIFMGTWCGDSRREVPRFIKLLESQNFDLEKLKIICLNKGFQNYKQAPEREERGMDIHRVPTFIFHDTEAKEIGRIVEEPVISLEQDLKDIMEGKAYETAYPVVNSLVDQFKNHSLKELRKMTPDLLEGYKDKSVGVYELNTYAYVLWSSWDLMKAEFILQLNTELYPDEAYTHSALARFKLTMGNNKEAMSSVKRGLKLEPENKGLLSMKENLE